MVAPLQTVIDFDAALTLSNGKRDLVLRAAQAFVRAYADLPQRVRAHAAAGHYTAVAELAHPIKGSAPLLGALQLQQAAAAVEDAVRDGAHAQLPRLIQDFVQAFEAAHAALQLLAPAAPPVAAASAAAPLLARLVPLLAAGDYSAGALLEQAGAALAGSAHAPQLERIAALFADLETEAAAALAAELAARLETGAAR
ncbi:Hpt domain-containing protein [Massilia sp. TS11]|uniref:Hpt domain-containing protein n=1 Tax=Massilia sp. TS11 TaxID=2908003 RepID=UPI001EDB186B|nr:Hpt domain-containing protein [Massilia sp. TS11]MCG2583598.1 Hpt domain-containing protein [Massilia sp. TS11]